MCCMRGGIWKGDILVEDVEELEILGASEIHARRLNAKEVLPLKSGEKFVFLSQMEESSWQEEISHAEHQL